MNVLNNGYKVKELRIQTKTDSVLYAEIVLEDSKGNKKYWHCSKFTFDLNDANEEVLETINPMTKITYEESVNKKEWDVIINIDGENI